MSDRNNTYRVLARKIKAQYPHDFLDRLAPLVSAKAEVLALEHLARRAVDPADALRLKTEALRARASYEHAVHHVVEMISDEPDGSDRVSALLGDDGDRLLADVLLDGDG